MTDDERFASLEGRIIALELFNRMVLTALANGQGGHPVAVLDRIRADMVSTLQHLDRPLGERSDAVWESAVEAIHEAFDSSRLRLVDQSGELE